MKRTLKLLHSLGAIGLTGALCAHIILLSVTPQPENLAQYAQMREGISAIARWMLLPSLGLVLVSGLMAMAFHTPFAFAGWVWAKLAMGVLVFEGTLVSIQGPAVRAAQASERAMAGEFDPALLVELTRGEWMSLWIVLALSLANIVLATWRPRFGRSKKTPD